MLGARVFTLNEFLELIIQTYIADDCEHQYLGHPARRLVATKRVSLGAIALHVAVLVRQSLSCSHILGHCHDRCWKKEVKFPVDTQQGQYGRIYEHDWVLQLLDVVVLKTFSTVLYETEKHKCDCAARGHDYEYGIVNYLNSAKVAQNLNNWSSQCKRTYLYCNQGFLRDAVVRGHESCEKL